MRHSHIDRRSRRYAATQGVSDYETLESLPMMQATNGAAVERTIGTVKFYNSAKGFGFLTRDDKKTDVFFHIRFMRNSGIQDEPREGERYEFDVVPQDGKGPAANNLRLIGR
jgi:CspA family cold shock protein